jgi:nucleotide-binding universal stress UspA family protein
MRGIDMRAIQRILVPIDGSEASLKGLRFAESIAGATRAGMIIVHVQDASMLELLRIADVGDGRFGGMREDELELLVRRHVSDPYFEAAKLVLGNKSVEVEFRAATGSPAAEICRFARDEEIDLIVMGAKGASDVAELLLGGVASQVLHHAPCPVTVVR